MSKWDLGWALDRLGCNRMAITEAFDQADFEARKNADKLLKEG
jgi:hypothetical protein